VSEPPIPELSIEIDGEPLKIPGDLPLLPVRSTVLFPGTTLPLAVGRPRSAAAVREAAGKGGFLAVVTQRKAEVDRPGPEDLYPEGVVTRILQVIDQGQGLSVMVLALARLKVVDLVEDNEFERVRIEIVHDRLDETAEAEAARRTVQRLAKEIIRLREDLPDELQEMVERLEDPGRLADLAAFGLNLSTDEKMQLLAQPDVVDRLRVLIRHLTREIRVAQVSKEFQRQAAGEIDEGGRKTLLREQLRKIHEELGEPDDQVLEADEIRTRIEEAGLPDDAAEVALREANRLASLPSHSPERSVTRTYLEWILDLPWGEETEDNLDLSHARQILDADHYDLERVKERILEYLAVRRLVAEPKGPILCFLGPPGVGKTSLGKSIARAMGRKFARMSLGGIRDEAEIRGHRRTYVGALPGRILQGLKSAGSRNPVFMLDEIDKLGVDYRGDPSSALLEVLDPEQNHAFSDHYLEVPFDLSKALFIGTANRTDTIPPPLLDRMEIIELPGYTAREKVRIAHDFLVPRQLEEHGLERDALGLSDEVLLRSIEEYTREPGVRNLERTIASLVRKSALQIAEGKGTLEIGVDTLATLLGPPRFTRESAERIARPGIAVGLVWTPVGGEIIFVEAARMEGKPALHLTGQLGDVMRESAEAALSYVRANAADLGIDPTVFEKYELHVHVPSGAMRKDGPSAGVTILVALASLFLDRKVRDDRAMTGEITLRGLVLPVGGVKEKVLAAHRAGIRELILPARNEKDLTEIPDEIREAVRFHFVETCGEALKEAIGG
jgi:ATP-dependent Lon protease